MASNLGWRLVSTALVCAALLGCPGKDGKDGASGVNSIVQLTPEAAGTNCPQGGTRVQSGADANHDGVLQASEVSGTQFVCNGATGANGRDTILATAPEAAGANCANGGTRIQSGLDVDGDATLDVAEVASTQYVCNGAAGSNGRTSLVATATEPAGTNCAAGGIRIQSGVDANGNATLDASEVVLTQFVCNGVAGTNAVSSLVATSAEAAGANCQNGGTRVQSGLDADADGTLDPAEVSATQYVCNGAPGANGLTALVSTAAEPAGANCPAGGTRIQSGLDGDADGTLDAAEVTSTRYACNGADGADGANGHASLVSTAPEAAGANCASGGVRIQSGLDADADGTLDLAEVTSTQFVCNGAAGANGQAALLALSPEPGGTNCANGGTRVQSGLDANGNGTLDPAEVSTTQYVCDGVDGANGQTSLVATTPEPAGASCANGGTRVQSGLDADGDDTLDPEEIASTRYVCNGANGTNGTNGQSSLVVTATEPAGANCASGGIRVQSGLDANANGFLEPAEIAVTQYVCDGADGANGQTSLVTTAQELPGANCQYGGTRIESGLDANGNRTLEADERTATQYACNGAPGAGAGTVIAFETEPAGPNCPYGGTRVTSGIDANGNGVLDPVEATATQYICNPDSTHPSVVAVSPAPGPTTVTPDTTFCVTFSEAIDPASIDGASFFLSSYYGSGHVAANVTYDAPSRTACLDPTSSLGWYNTYALNVGGGIRDLAGNPLFPQFTASYDTGAPVLPNLRVTIDSITPGTGTVEVAYTVSNTDSGAAGPFTVGFFVNPSFSPGVGSIPDASADVAGLAPYTATSGTITITADPAATIFAYVDVNGAVAEWYEFDNLGTVAPALTGTIVATPSTVEEMAFLSVTLPVNAVTRCASVRLGTDWMTGTWLDLGFICGNDAGQGSLSGSFYIPQGMSSFLGTASVWATVEDLFGSSSSQYVANAASSTSNLVRYGSAYGPPVDSGIPLTFVTVTPSTAPNLTVTVDAITPGAGTVDVAYTVTNGGFGDAGPFSVGFFVDPVMPPGVGGAADATADLPGVARGASVNGVITLAASSTSSVMAYVDVGGVVAETSEYDNVGALMAKMTASPVISPSTVEQYGILNVTVPVNVVARFVEIMLGGDVDDLGSYPYTIGQLVGNQAGVISGSVTVPAWFPPGDYTVWIRVMDDSGSGLTYARSSSASAENYVVYSGYPGTWTDTGIPLTPITVLPPTSPNLTVTIDSVTPGAGTVDVAYTVSNVGYGDAGPFSVGFFVDPAATPSVGSLPDATADVTGLRVGATSSGVVTIAATPSATVLAYVDVGGAVSELNETDNLGRLLASITGTPIVTPATVEATGSFQVTVPVSPNTRLISISLGGDWGSWDTYVGSSSGNFQGEGTITGTFTLPAWMQGTWSIWVRVADDGWQLQRLYAPVGSTYAMVDWTTGSVIAQTTIPTATVTVVRPTSPNLVVSVDSAVPGAPGTVDVGFTVTNNGYSAAGASTLGFFVDPMALPGVGATPDVAVDVAPLPIGGTFQGTVTLAAGANASVYAYADVTGAVAETNEADNLAVPPPTLTGPIVATPTTVDEGTALTLTIPVSGSVRRADVYLGTDLTSSWSWIGTLSGNYDGQGALTGSVVVPQGQGWPSIGTASVFVILSDDRATRQIGYAAYSTFSTDNYVRFDVTNGSETNFADSGIPLTRVTIVRATRPNLTVTIDQIVPGADTVDVIYTVRNTGAGDAGPFAVGLFVDPATVPGAGSPPDQTEVIDSLPRGGGYTGTRTLTATATSAIFAYADVLGAIDEQSETDNAAWFVAAPAMIGQPTVSAPVVAVGGTVDVTVPVSESVRQIEVYLGTAAVDSPGFLIGAGAGNAAGEGTIQVTCTLPPGSAGDWYVWVATYDRYDLRWLGYLSFAPVSATFYTEFDPAQNGPPSTPTSIPLTALTVTP